MAVELVTGRSGAAHVDSGDVGAYNAATQGPGVYVLSGCACSLTGSNAVTLSSGELLVEGRHVRVTSDIELPIDSGEIGFFRTDFVVVRYHADTETAVETASIEVIKGTPSASEDSGGGVASGSILAGDTDAIAPLYAVNLTETTANEPEAVCTALPPYAETLSLMPVAGLVSRTVTGGNINDLTAPGNYFVDANSDGVINRPMLDEYEPFLLNTLPNPLDGNLMQTARGLLSGTEAFRRRHDNGGSVKWNEWCQNVTTWNSDWENLTSVVKLWEGDAWMAGTTTINLDRPVSGMRWLELLWSYCDTSGSSAQTKDNGWVSTLVSMQKWGYGDGHCFFLAYSPDLVAFKYLYIYKQKIVGHSDNAKEGTGSAGIKYNNKVYSLRGVYGHY